MGNSSLSTNHNFEPAKKLVNFERCPFYYCAQCATSATTSTHEPHRGPLRHLRRPFCCPPCSLFFTNPPLLVLLHPPVSPSFTSLCFARPPLASLTFDSISPISLDFLLSSARHSLARFCLTSLHRPPPQLPSSFDPPAKLGRKTATA